MMNQALIDLGSNTIKLAVYRLDEEGFTCIRYESRYGYVVRYIQAGQLSDEGVGRIREIITEYQEIAREYSCKAENGTLLCFSTASLRYIDNIQNVIKNIKKTNSIIISPISGEEEARCNFFAMQYASKSSDFFGGDMGGGSMQLFRSEDNRLAGYQSYPIGSLKLYRDFVEGTLPTRQEAEAIAGYVKEKLKEGKLTAGTSAPLYLMGGTIRLITGLLGKTVFQAEELSGMTERFLESPEHAQKEIERITPERLNSILPGMICLNTVAGFFGVDQMRFTESSVREGYLLAHVLPGKGQARF